MCYKMWCIRCAISCDKMWYIMYVFMWYVYIIPLLNMIIKKWRNCKAVWAIMSILVYPLHWGSIQGEEVWTPHLLCCTVLLACVNQTPNEEANGCGTDSHPLSLFPYIKFLFLPQKAWGHALLRGGVCDTQGIWVILGLLPLGSTLYILYI